MTEPLVHYPYSPVALAVHRVGSLEGVGRLYTPPISKQAVFKWVKRGCVPASRVRVLSKASGIDRSALNPAFAR